LGKLENLMNTNVRDIPGTEIQSDVAAKAVGAIKEKVEDELNIPDPDEQIAKAMLKEKD